MTETLSPRELADAVGASESSVKRWVDNGRIAARKTAGGHRRIPRDEAIRYIRASGLAVPRPEILGFAELLDTSPAGSATSDALYLALRRGQRDRAIGLITGPFLEGRGIAWICDTLLRDALSEIGTLWQHGQEGIFIEHRAIDICLQAVTRLRDALPAASPQAPVAIGGAPASDPYLLPSQMVAAVLQEEGWRAENLGPDTPLEVLARGAREQHARLVWLSCSSDDAAGDVRSRLADFSGELAAEGRRLVVGGRALNGRPVRGNDAIVHLQSMAELDAFARGLRGRSS
jgi:excisionase family DNA binding protein